MNAVNATVEAGVSGTIVYAYSGARWSDFPGRQFMLTRALARYCRVFFLELGGSRGRTNWRPVIRETESGVYVVENALRLRRSGPGRKLRWVAAPLDASYLNSALRAMGVGEYVYWCSVSDPMLFWSMPTGRLVYDCIDPNFEPAHQAEFDRNERAAARKARLVFATAETLFERMRSMHHDVVLVPNGAPDEQTPAREMPRSGRPGQLADRRGPVVGYLGTVDWRFDAAVVVEAARALPDVTFCIAGHVSPSGAESAARLRGLSNVVMPGALSREEGDAYTAAFDVGLIPFTPGDMNDAINSCKMYSYLWAGKPVVATDLRECRRHAPLVLTASAGVSLAQRISEALALPASDAVRRQQFAVENSWDVRARQAVAELQKRKLLPQSPTTSESPSWRRMNSR